MGHVGVFFCFSATGSVVGLPFTKVRPLSPCGIPSNSGNGASRQDHPIVISQSSGIEFRPLDAETGTYQKISA